MSCEILEQIESWGTRQVFICNTTDVAFGPVMDGDAEEYKKWLRKDPREYTADELVVNYNYFKEEKEKNTLYKCSGDNYHLEACGGYCGEINANAPKSKEE